MKNTVETFSRGTAGNALIELALTLPILVLLMVGIADFGRYAYAAIEVSSAAHAGALYGAQNHATASDNAGMTTAATSAAPDVPGLANGTATNKVTPSHFCACSDGSSSDCTAASCTGKRIIEFVQVDTIATINPIFHYPGFPQTLALKGKAIVRVEQ